MDLLDVEIEDVRTVGIWGMGGVGKTTVAKFVYNQLMVRFEYCSFLGDIRERSQQPNGMVSLQRKLISDIVRHHQQEEIVHVDKGKVILKDRLCNKRVLILLDDIDRISQLRNLLPCLHCLAPGSRIMITTRDRGVLVDFQVNRIYEVTEMNHDDSLALFCKHAFKQRLPIPEYAELSWEITKATRGLPLAIEVIGSYLSSRLQINIWQEALDRLRKEPQIQQRLRISIDTLNPDEKEIFLDAACLFSGMDCRVLVHMWRACGFSPASAIEDLQRRSLIKIEEDNVLWMHDILKNLGREIVREEKTNEPGRRSRLWDHDEAIEVLKYEEGTPEVKAICLELDHRLVEEEEVIEGRDFDKLTNLLFLNLGGANLQGNFRQHLGRLRWLSWNGRTVLNMPPDLHLRNLVVLNMSGSAVKADWTGWGLVQVLRKLEVINLKGCHHLRGTPQFNSFQPIKRLILDDCQALHDLDQSIGNLKSLESLSLENCCSLERLPQEMSSLSSLTELVIDGNLITEIPIPEETDSSSCRIFQLVKAEVQCSFDASCG